MIFVSHSSTRKKWHQKREGWRNLETKPTPEAEEDKDYASIRTLGAKRDFPPGLYTHDPNPGDFNLHYFEEKDKEGRSTGNKWIKPVPASWSGFNTEGYKAAMDFAVRGPLAGQRLKSISQTRNSQNLTK